MPLFYPDNDNRETRVIQLGSDAQDYLFQAQLDYDSFENLLKSVNTKIAQAYQDAGLQPPAITSVDILKAAGINGGSATFDIAKILADIAGFFGTVKFLVPGATKALVKTGAMTARTAEKVLADFTIPLVEKNVVVTVGDVAGTIVGGLVGGLAVTGLDLGIDAIEGHIARDKLREGIHQVFPMRAGTKLSQQKAATLLDSLKAVDTTLDAITGGGLTLTQQLITNLINKDVSPAVKKADAITPATVAADLKKLDLNSKAWTLEDPS